MLSQANSPRYLILLFLLFSVLISPYFFLCKRGGHLHLHLPHWQAPFASSFAWQTHLTSHTPEFQRGYGLMLHRKAWNYESCISVNWRWTRGNTQYVMLVARIRRHLPLRRILNLHFQGNYCIFSIFFKITGESSFYLSLHSAFWLVLDTETVWNRNSLECGSKDLPLPLPPRRPASSQTICTNWTRRKSCSCAVKDCV